jgi:hypothetical protein
LIAGLTGAGLGGRRNRYAGPRGALWWSTVAGGPVTAAHGPRRWRGIGSTIGRRLGDGLGEGLFGALDDVAGGAVGVLQGVLVVWLVGGFLAIGPFPRLAAMAQTSAIVRSMGTVAPSPEELAGGVADLLDDSGLPDLFVGLEPLPASPVERPTDPEAAAIGRRAEASTVKVTSAACTSALTGSGAVIRPGYVVTNAHVVAGARTTQGGRGRRHLRRDGRVRPSLDGSSSASSPQARLSCSRSAT